LAKRYQQLVTEHLNSTDTLSAGLRALPNKSASFASTQAAWRFYKNDSVSLTKLHEPLLVAAHEGVAMHCREYALCVHDWSRLNYRKHDSKLDKYQISHETDVGYDLQSSIILSDQTGKPIAPVAQRLVTANGSYTTYQEDTFSETIENHLDEVTHCISKLDQQNFTKPLVHIIDREADSIGHIRQWETNNCLWLTRSKKTSSIEFQGNSMSCAQVAEAVHFEKTRLVDYHGKPQWQWVAETPVRLTRDAKPSQKKQKKPSVPGKPIDARLVISHILSDEGEILAEWLLITTVMAVDASEIALWYYWRWQIECFFKLLKKAGHDLESWQQETGLAIAKRLLVVSMACVVVWEIAAAKDEKAETLRTFLIKLSGRQMKWGKSFTNPALLAGLWIFLSMLEVLDCYSPEELAVLQKTAQNFLM
jgi:hypothetical protein